MEKVESMQVLDEIKVLADPRRLAILRLLMTKASTLTQLALSLKHSPAWIRHHVLVVEFAGFVELTEIRTTENVTE